MRVRQATLPYPPAPAESVTASAWLTTNGAPLPERVVDWDPASDLHLHREVAVSPSHVVEACQLSGDSRLAIVAQIRSDRTALRVVGEAVAIDPSAAMVRETLSVHAVGQALGGTLSLTTSLIWDGGPPGGPLSPRRRGSELWSDEVRCVLEGSAARFPISPVAFSGLPTLDPEAAWTLDWEPTQLEDPVLGAVRLLVNIEHPRIREPTWFARSSTST